MQVPPMTCERPNEAGVPEALRALLAVVGDASRAPKAKNAAEAAPWSP